MKIMIHVKNKEIIENYKNFLLNGYDENIKYSKEIRFMIENFVNNNWDVYLSCIDCLDYDDNIWNEIYHVNKNEYLNLSLEDVNSKIDVMIIRVIGSVEGNFYNIKKYLNYLINNYKGLVLNNPKAMVRGMTKHYLTEIDKDELLEMGINLIPTKIYNNDINYNDLVKDYINKENYLIKPVSGELSNSLSNLSNISEEWLRYKENKVLGWVVQPMMKEIWNGEYQILFLNKKMIYAQQKIYKQDEGNVPNQKTRILEKYNPTNEELDIIEKLINYFSNIYNIEINICRIDFMKNDKGEPILLEFEMVNPGFFIGYMANDDKDILNIINNIREYCENIIKNRV